MTTTHRFTLDPETGQSRGLFVQIDGQVPPYIIECRTSRGFDQELGTAEIVHAHAMPDYVMEGSRVVITMGDPDSTEPGGGMQVRFSGYVTTFSSTLYPGRHTAICSDSLWWASRIRRLQDTSLANLTDIEAIEFILGVGYPPEMLDIQGSGLVLRDLDDIQILWTPEMTALEMIKNIDQVSPGYRTYALTDGRIVRRQISLIPTDAAVRVFTEGVDIFDGSSDTDSEDPYTSFTAEGPSGTFTFDENDPEFVEPDLSMFPNPYFQRVMMLSQVADSMSFASYEARMTWVATQLSKKLIRGSFSTHIDMLFQGAETIELNSEHLEVGQKLFIQNIQDAVESNGKYSATISWLSERLSVNRGVTRPWVLTGGTGTVGPLTAPLPAAQTTVPASNADILATFAVVSIIRELVIRGGVETFIYHVTCQDTSTSRSGAIVTRAWVAAGPGVTITTGDQLYFMTTFTDLSTATIQITVTDSIGSTGTTTRSMANPGVPTMTEKLYATDATQWWAFDGTQWRAHTPSNGQAPTAVAHGPFFAARGLAGTTSDDFATAAVESLPFGTDVSAIGAVWKEPDVTTAFAAGNAAGNVALSANGSTGWSIKTDPTGAPILRIIVSRFRPGEIHLISSTGYWVSDNYGSGWRLVRSGSYVDLNLAAHSWNVLVTAAGGLIDATTGTAFTFPSLSPAVQIVAATHHIRLKGVYAMDTEGRTFYTAAYGTMALVQGSTIPAGEAQPRGIYRSGVAIGKIYCALGTGGLAEHTAGFEGDEGWELIRAGTTAWP